MGASQSQFKVLIVDDHEVVRKGLRSFLHQRGRIQIVGEAGTVKEALEQVASTEPDVVIMDVRLPDGSGAEACREIRGRYPQIKVLILTSYSDEEAFVTSILAGASGYVLKDAPCKDLAKAVETVAQNGSLLDIAVAKKAIESLLGTRLPEGGASADSWTSQEAKLISLLAEGKSNREIAQEMCLAEKTVKNYVSSILTKLKLKRRSQVAAYVARRRYPRQPGSFPLTSMYGDSDSSSK